MVSIAGAWPRFMDVNTGQHASFCATAENAGGDTTNTFLQLVGSQTFFDYYGNGGGAFAKNLFRTDGAYGNPYSMFNNNQLRPSARVSTQKGHGVCISADAGGCIGTCDLAGLQAARAAATTKAVVGTITGVLGFATSVYKGSVGAAIVGTGGTSASVAGRDSASSYANRIRPSSLLSDSSRRAAISDDCCVTNGLFIMYSA